MTMAHLTLSRVATTLSSSSRSITNGITKRQFAILTQSEEFPDIPKTAPSTATPSSTPQITTLPSGLTIVTEPSSRTSTISLTFPSAGSSNETISESGAALANKSLSFKSSADLSSLVILRTLEDAGATPFTFAGRRGAGLGFTVASGGAESLVPLIGANCGFEKWDVKAASGVATAAVKEAMGNAQTVLTEQLYAAAYGAQSPLGRAFHTAPPSPAAIRSFRERTYVSSGAVLAATGISDHDAFVATVGDSFDLGAGEAPGSDATPAYMGGEARLFAPSAGTAHVAIAFEANYSNAVLNVLKGCLQGVAPAGVQAFAAQGLVGVYGAGGGEVADALCDVLLGEVSTEVIAAATKKAKAEAILALGEGSKSLANAMTSSVLESCGFTFEGVGAAYDAVTEADVKSALSGMVKGNPAMAAIGDISAVPYHATVAARFK